MVTSTELEFLQTIANAGDDDTPRLVFADWLEERGDADRAELIRVQCELATGEAPSELRVRERQLLTAHRQRLVDALGLPVEDVIFLRGLPAALRISRWDGEFTQALAGLGMLVELDLSDVALRDEGLQLLLNNAEFPALRKLILSNCGLTNRGAVALAESSAMPQLDTLYLFGNAITPEGSAALEFSTNYILANLDTGEFETGYCLSRGQTDVARRAYVREKLLPLVNEQFAKYKQLQSAMLAVGQFWCDEANDAVHGEIVISELPEPVLLNVRERWDDDDDYENPNLPENPRKLETSMLDLYDNDIVWHDNSDAIPLWAAYADEGGYQDHEFMHQVYSPAVLFYPHGGYEFVPMKRSFLDGIRPEYYPAQE